MSLTCFRRTGGKGLDRDADEEGCCDEHVGPGQCLRALLTHMWWKRHDSSELALNGVRAGGARHRSSIQKVKDAWGLCCIMEEKSRQVVYGKMRRIFGLVRWLTHEYRATWLLYVTALISRESG